MTISHFSPKWPCLRDCGVNLLEGLPYYYNRVYRTPPPSRPFLDEEGLGEGLIFPWIFIQRTVAHKS